MTDTHWIFISPHLDDVALSCGGLVWDLAREGDRVEVWSVVAGDPPEGSYSDFAEENHQRWGQSGREAMVLRREEDWAACRVLDAEPRHLDFIDAIYRSDPKTRRPIVNNNDELFGKRPETWLVAAIAARLACELPADARVVFPLGLGGHIDHRAVVAAGQMLGRSTAWYADYPYILKHFVSPLLTGSGLGLQSRQLDEDALAAWQEAVLCYASQIGDFWRDAEETRLALRNYMAGGGGRLWVWK
ncbi:MAG: PIG-L family deacetylase [Chloroflexota bacterium]|nr:PIG-L family deacetylase [Chloroflexota bacterium]